MFSSRSGRSRAPNQLAELLDGFRVQARPFIDLTRSNPTRAGLAYPEALLQALLRAQSQSLVYDPEPFGSVTARTAVAQHFARSRARQNAPAPADIMLSASTSEAYAFLFKLLCDPGDAVLIPAPSYPLFEHLAELEAVQALPYRLAYDGAWHIDLDSVRRAITARTRAIIVVSPNNPSGQYVTNQELAALASTGLPLISDEVFHDYPLLQQLGRGAGQVESGALCFSLGGLSKLCGSPQLKLAWTIISGPASARREARERLELIADTFLSVATPIQAALPDLLAASPAITRAILERCRQNVAVLQQALSSSPVTALRVEGGWSAVLQLPKLASEEALVMGLLREQAVLVQPGWFYDFESEPFAIVSLLGEPLAFREGVQRLVAYVARLAG